MTGHRPNRGGAIATQRERANATRAALIEAARSLFGECGYHNTGTTEIVARAKVTRGALYHHFADKRDLFCAVFRTVSAEIVMSSNSAVSSLSGDLWRQVTEAFRQYLDLVATHKEYQRILLIDGPTVLGWADWRAIQSEFVAKGTAEALAMLMDQGLVASQPTEPLAHLLQAALHDAALALANSDGSTEASDPVIAAFLALLGGLKSPCGQNAEDNGWNRASRQRSSRTHDQAKDREPHCEP